MKVVECPDSNIHIIRIVIGIYKKCLHFVFIIDSDTFVIILTRTFNFNVNKIYNP